MSGVQTQVNVAGLPVTGAGATVAYAMSGPESFLFMFLVGFTLYAAAKSIWNLSPRFGS